MGVLPLPHKMLTEIFESIFLTSLQCTNQNQALLTTRLRALPISKSPVKELPSYTFLSNFIMLELGIELSSSCLCDSTLATESLNTAVYYIQLTILFYLLYNSFNFLHSFFLFVNFNSDIKMACISYPEQWILASHVEKCILVIVTPSSLTAQILLLHTLISTLPFSTLTFSRCIFPQ